jgi:glutamate-1-semialdehyde 2,1-aminomutase
MAAYRLLLHLMSLTGSCVDCASGGIPVAVYGFSAAVAQQLQGRIQDDESDTGGIGGTLAGNALSMAAMRATLEHVLTDDAFR